MRTRFFIRPLGALAAALLVSACASAAPPTGEIAPVPQTEVGAFAATIGSDTVAVEEFTRSAERLEGRQIIRTPRTQIRDYVATLNPDSTISRFEISFRAPDEAEPAQRATIDFGADSATVQITRGDSTQTIRLPAREGAIPFLSYSFALYELPLMQLRGSARDSLATDGIPIGGQRTIPLTLQVLGPDSVLLTNIAGQNRLFVGPEGRLLAWDGTGSTLKLFAERAAVLDVDRVATDWAAVDREGRGLGTLSPRDTTRATIGGAELLVDYGRPSRRGREIFGNVVPWGEVWRTGANQATHFGSTQDLEIGGVDLPTGTYTLWTLPSPAGWQLIINRQTGQWGTDYDPAQDLARIPLQVTTLPQPVEQFTIAIEPEGEQGGELRLMWDDTQASVPFVVR